MKKLLATLKAAEKRLDKADRALFNAADDADTTELERISDEAFDAVSEAQIALVNAICKVSRGMIDNKTARLMLLTKRAELEALINRMA